MATLMAREDYRILQATVCHETHPPFLTLELSVSWCGLEESVVILFTNKGISPLNLMVTCISARIRSKCSVYNHRNKKIDHYCLLLKSTMAEEKKIIVLEFWRQLFE